MRTFIYNSLQKTTFQVRLGQKLSENFEQENGVLQGGVGSVINFSLLMNQVAKMIPKDIKFTMYADDLAIYIKAKRLTTAERRLQLAINNIVRWSNDVGLKISKNKTKCMLFTKRRVVETPELKIGNEIIPNVREQKFLGLTWDRKMTWIPHIRNLKESCRKSLNLLGFVSNRKWGADRKMLENLYNALILSKLDYGNTLYSTASETALKKLNPIQNQAMRIITGAFRSSPIVSLNVESNITPLDLHRLEEQAKTTIRTLRNTKSPATKLIKTEWEKEETAWRQIERIKEEFFPGEAIPKIANFKPEGVAPWEIKTVKTCTKLEYLDKSKEYSAKIRDDFETHRNEHSGETEIYTDGSKTDTKVGSAAIAFKGGKTFVTKKKTLSKYATVFTAESYAIIDAIDICERTNDHKITIYSDSKSVIKAIENKRHQNPIIQKIQNKLYDTRKDIHICWIPSHCGIPGNEAADKAAKEASEILQAGKEPIPHRDIFQHITKKIKEKWTLRWQKVPISNKLKEIKEEIKKWSSSYHKDRHKETTLARLRLGHVNITHRHLMERKQPPVCIECREGITVKHLLIKCKKYKRERMKYFPDIVRMTDKEAMGHLLGDNQSRLEKLFLFLGETKLYKAI